MARRIVRQGNIKTYIQARTQKTQNEPPTKTGPVRNHRLPPYNTGRYILEAESINCCLLGFEGPLNRKRIFAARPDTVDHRWRRKKRKHQTLRSLHCMQAKTKHRAVEALQERKQAGTRKNKVENVERTNNTVGKNAARPTDTLELSRAVACRRYNTTTPAPSFFRDFYRLLVPIVNLAICGVPSGDSLAPICLPRSRKKSPASARVAFLSRARVAAVMRNA